MIEDANANTKNELSIISWVFAVISIVLASFLSINSFNNFYKLQILNESPSLSEFSFFTENSFTWANLIFGFLFLGGIYICYLGIKQKKSFNIFASLVYTFALISLFVSYVS